jgi:hypothetical protein
LLISLSVTSLSLSLFTLEEFPLHLCCTTVELLYVYIDTVVVLDYPTDMSTSWNAVDVGDGGQLGVSLWGGIAASLALQANIGTGKCVGKVCYTYSR